MALTDFGIARILGSDQVSGTRSGQVVGTAAYLAPEQVLGLPVSPVTDVYALGVVVAVALMHTQLPPPPLPDHIPAAVRAVVMRALAKDPAQRYATAQEMAQAAEAALDEDAPGRPDHAVTSTVERPTSPGLVRSGGAHSRSRLAWAATTVAVLLFGVATVLAIRAAGSSTLRPGERGSGREDRPGPAVRLTR